jgi:hypothetical protein
MTHAEESWKCHRKGISPVVEDCSSCSSVFFSGSSFEKGETNEKGCFPGEHRGSKMNFSADVCDGFVNENEHDDVRRSLSYWCAMTSRTDRNNTIG